MNSLQKTIILSVLTLLHTNNSFGMLRILTKSTVQSSMPKYARPIMRKYTPEEVKIVLSESRGVNRWYEVGLNRNKSLSPKDKTTRLLLQTQTSLIENIQHLNNENIKTLQAKNTTELYDMNDFSQQIDLLEFLENELADRGLFHRH